MALLQVISPFLQMTSAVIQNLNINFALCSDFVAAARDVFDLRLDDRTRTLNASTLQFALRDINEMSPADVEKVSNWKKFYCLFSL